MSLGRILNINWAHTLGDLSQFFCKELGELFQLWSDDELAIGVVRIVCEIVLVSRWSWIKMLKRFDFSDDIVPNFFAGEVFDDFFGNHFLIVVVVKDGGAILRADIVALTVERRRVVDGEKNFHQCYVVNNLRVVVKVNDFGVSRVTLADALVGWIFCRSSTKARDDIFNPVEAFKHRL